MKKFLFLFSFLLLFACQENHKKEHPKIIGKPEVGKSVEQPASLLNLCFLSTIGSSEIQGKTVQDSLVLKLKIEANKVSGIYNWIPAEKDARRGKLLGTKEGNFIRGKYIFVQEGMEQTQSIIIELHDDFAKVTTNPGLQGKMLVKIEKVECKNTL